MRLDLDGGIFLWWGSMRGRSGWAPQHHGTTAKCHLLSLENPHVVPEMNSILWCHISETLLIFETHHLDIAVTQSSMIAIHRAIT